MKKILLVVIVSSLFLTACYDNYNTYYYIENNTSTRITCKFLPIDSLSLSNIHKLNKIVSIEPNSTIKILEYLSTDGVYWVIDGSLVDSIEVCGYKDSCFFMYPDEYAIENNSMFVFENWIEQIDDHDYSYTYQFK